jgi:hypothetical protein
VATLEGEVFQASQVAGVVPNKTGEACATPPHSVAAPQHGQIGKSKEGVVSEPTANTLGVFYRELSDMLED